MGPVQLFAQLYAEYHTKSLVCSVGWNHVKFQHFYHPAICLKIGGRGKVVLEFYLVILFCGGQFYEVLIWWPKDIKIHCPGKILLTFFSRFDHFLGQKWLDYLSARSWCHWSVPLELHGFNSIISPLNWTILAFSYSIIFLGLEIWSMKVVPKW